MEKNKLLLVFDIDGTLTKNNDIATVAFRKTVFDIFGITHYNEKWNEYKKDSDTGIVEEIVYLNQRRIVTKSELLFFQSRYLSHFNTLVDSAGDRIAPVDGLMDFFASIRESSLASVALFTGGFPAVALRKLELISVEKQYLMAAAFDGQTREEVFLKCLLRATGKYSHRFSNVVMFGDSLSDARIASCFRIPIVGVATNLTANAFFDAGVANVICDYNNLDIEELIQNVNNRFKLSNNSELG